MVSLYCSAIPPRYSADLPAIERRGNPYAWRDENLLDSYRQFEHLGLFVGNKLVAFVLYQCVGEEAEIIHIVCDKAHQGKGYARHLLAQLIENLRKTGVTTLFLDVREDNTRARQIYTQLGFVTVGRRKNYYGDSSGGRHDALIQRLRL